MALAVYNRATNTVLTFVRPDTTARPPAGYEFVTETELPDGWTMAPPEPSPPVTWTAAEFLARFTDAEQDAIELSDTPIARKARRTLFTNTEVRSDSANLAALMAGLVAAGLLTQQRAHEILTP